MSVRSRIDPFTLLLLATVALASLLPVQGRAAAVLDIVTNVAIAALFFLHGARLSREAIVAGALHWRLHLTILACTFALFPLSSSDDGDSSANTPSSRLFARGTVRIS